MRIIAGFILMVFAGSALAQDLPPEVRRDMYLSLLARHLKAREFYKSLDQITKLRALGIELPSAVDYFAGEASCRTKNFIACERALKAYIGKTGAKGRYYQRTLPLLAEAEEKAAALRRERKAAAAAAKLAAEKKVAARAKNVAQKKTGLLELTFGGAKGDGAQSIAALPDGGLVFAGVTASKGAGEFDAWIVRLDEFGVIKWEKTVGGPKTDRADRVVVLAEGGIIVAGHSWHNTEQVDRARKGAWVARFDGGGRQLWKTDLPVNRSQTVHGLVVAPGGGVVVAISKFKSQANFIGQIFRYDGQGRLLWNRTFDHKKRWRRHAPRDIAALPGGGFIMAGKRTSGGGNDAWVIRLDARGRTLWETSFGGKEDDWAYSIKPLPDNGFIVAGYTYSKTRGNREAWVFRLDAEGAMLWQKTFGGNGGEEAKSAVALANGDFVILGTTTHKGTRDTDAWIMRLDARGRILAGKSYGGESWDNAKDVIALPDGWLAIVGSTNSKGAGKSDAWVVLTCELTCGVATARPSGEQKPFALRITPGPTGERDASAAPAKREAKSEAEKAAMKAEALIKARKKMKRLFRY